MTDPLDTLRPEVREALKSIEFACTVRYSGEDEYAIIRAELLRLADENARLLALCTDHAEWRQVNHEAWFAAKERAERAEAERDALRKQIPTVDELHALERCHKSQEVLRAQLDKANLDDPYASLMVAEDAMLLAGLIERFHAAQR